MSYSFFLLAFFIFLFFFLQAVRERSSSRHCRQGRLLRARQSPPRRQDRTIRESDRQWTHFEKVSGQCPVEYILRTHVGVVCRVDAEAIFCVSCLLKQKT